MKVNLQDQVALVTGAAQGIGKSIAEAMADNGARVVLTDIVSPRVVEAAQTRHNCVSKELDVTDQRQIDEVIDWTVEEFGRLDIVVNNAGVDTLDHRVTIDEFSREEWDRLLDVDLNGLFSVSKAAARVMRSQGSGRIINIASVAGLVQCGCNVPLSRRKPV